MVPHVAPPFLKSGGLTQAQVKERSRLAEELLLTPEMLSVNYELRAKYRDRSQPTAMALLQSHWIWLVWLLVTILLAALLHSRKTQGEPSLFEPSQVRFVSAMCCAECRACGLSQCTTLFHCAAFGSKTASTSAYKII
jgi:hypothetical protein